MRARLLFMSEHASPRRVSNSTQLDRERPNGALAAFILLVGLGFLLSGVGALVALVWVLAR